MSGEVSLRPEDITDEVSETGYLLELLTRGRPAWMKDAACQEAPLSVSWFPDLGQSAQPAKMVCDRCLCKWDCRAWSLAQGPELDGVWAGLTATERRAVRNGKRAA